MNHKLNLLLSSASLSALLLSSCGPDKVEVRDEQITTDTLKKQVVADVNLIRANIPSPSVISKNFNKAGYTYMKNLLNPSSKGSGYSSKYQAALGLGAYGADLSYIGSYGQNGDAAEYLGQLGKLSQQLKIESAFDPAFIQRMSNAKGDSINQMTDEVFDKAERNLRSNDRMATAALVIAGGWVEGLHVAVDAISTKPKDAKNADLYHDIYVHVYSFQYVKDLLQQYDKDADCKKLLDDLKPFEPVIANYGNMTTLSDKEMPALKDAITTLRNKLL
jgi:hypothetical protein